MKGKITKWDITLIVFILLICVFLFVMPFVGEDDGLTVEIYSNGELVTEKHLSDLLESETVTLDGCVILLENDSASFISSQCPDKLCIKRGKLKLAGDTMACVPEKTVVVLKKEKDSKFDIITY